MRARRLPIVDEYVDGDQIAVFAAGHLTVLSPVASATLLAVGDEWTRLSDITELVMGAVGPPPLGSPEDAVAEVLLTLQDRDLVEVCD